MKRIAVLLASLVTTAALSLGLVAATAPAATAVEPARLSTPSMCVRPDFTVTGSGWPVHAAVRMWAEAQTTVQITTHLVPGCVVVPVRHIMDRSGDWCGAADIQGIITDQGHIATDIEIMLNDNCLDYAGRGWRRTSIAHELGHAMGLDHIASTRSVMYDYHGTRKTIAPVDVRALLAVYG